MENRPPQCWFCKNGMLVQKCTDVIECNFCNAKWKNNPLEWATNFDYHKLIESYMQMNTQIMWPDGRSRCMDIDSVSYNGDYSFFRSGKTFYQDKINIKMTEFGYWAMMKKRNPDWDVYFTACYSNTKTADDDLIWYIPFDVAYNLKQDNKSTTRDWVIPQDKMERLPRKEFSFYGNRMLDLKGMGKFYDAKDEAIRSFEKNRNWR